MLTYPQAAKDIVKMAAVVTPENTAEIMTQTKLFGDTLALYATQHGGWMLLTAFTIALTELRKTIAQAEPDEQKLITEIMQSILGSFGKTLN